eukprot:15457480-Alexandrium_andersonii.AAC.1
MLATAAARPARAACAPALLERNGVPGLLVPVLDSAPVRRPGAPPAVHREMWCSSWQVGHHQHAASDA